MMTVQPRQGGYEPLGASIGRAGGGLLGMMLGRKLKDKWEREKQELQRAQAIVQIMKQSYSERYKHYQDDLTGYDPLTGEKGKPVTDIRGKQVTGALPPEGSQPWAKAVLKEYGDILPPEQRLEAQQAKMKLKILQRMEQAGGPGPGQGPGTRTGAGAGPLQNILFPEAAGQGLKQLQVYASLLGVDIKQLAEQGKDRRHTGTLRSQEATAEAKLGQDQAELTALIESRAAAEAGRAGRHKDTTVQSRLEEIGRRVRHKETLVAGGKKAVAERARKVEQDRTDLTQKTLSRQEKRITGIDKSSWVNSWDKMGLQAEARMQTIVQLRDIPALDEADEQVGLFVYKLLGDARSTISYPCNTSQPRFKSSMNMLATYLMRLHRMKPELVRSIVKDQLGALLADYDRLTEAEQEYAQRLMQWARRIGVQVQTPIR